MQIWNPWDKFFELNPLEIFFFQWSCVVIKKRGSEGISARQSNRGGELNCCKSKGKVLKEEVLGNPIEEEN